MNEFNGRNVAGSNALREGREARKAERQKKLTGLRFQASAYGINSGELAWFRPDMALKMIEEGCAKYEAGKDPRGSAAQKLRDMAAKLEEKVIPKAKTYKAPRDKQLKSSLTK